MTSHELSHYFLNTKDLIKKFAVLLSILPLTLSCGRGPADALRNACAVADRLISDTSFELKEVPAGQDGSCRKLVIPENAAFRKHPYGEWHYANGATLTGLRYLSNAAGREDYREHIRKWRDWNVAQADAFREDYERYYPAVATQNYRMFRREMLDDTSAPCLPLVSLAVEGDSSPRSDAIIETMADYLLHGQYRLPDGCLVRPEPEWTVWCDDAFMGCAFLCRYAEWKGDPALLEECVRQLKLFHTHLLDEGTGLLWHGWHAGTDRHVGALWGRAEGWYVWALSEVLERLEPGSAAWRDLSVIERGLLDALIPFQDRSGLWHQLLDHPESYCETSCTALFTAAIARAVREGRLPRRYRKYALRGWRGIESRIDRENGIVSGICRSMAIQETLEGYTGRETADNDPRGLGAFFWAAAEISQL